MKPLLELAREKFGTLIEGEIAALESLQRGQSAWLGPNLDYSDVINSPLNDDTWTEKRQVRAEIVRWLCIDPDAVAFLSPRGLKIGAARILGRLDLSFLSLNFPLFFLRCSFREGIDCKYAQTRTISLNGSFVRELAGNAVSINGTFNLAKNFSGEGEICLVDAEISGSLVFIDGVISNPGGIAISADRARIGGGVFFREGFKAVGEVRLAGSRINAGLDGTGSVFSNPGKIAFSADKATIDGDIFLV